MSEPVKRQDGWFIDTPDGESGPWTVRAAAVAVGEDNMTQAHMIENRAKQREKVYKGQRK